MASVRKRTWLAGDGERTSWVADYFDQAGKRHIKTFKTRKAAVAWLGQTQHEVKEGIHTPEASSITVLEAAEVWLQRGALEGLERGTLRQYQSHVEIHIASSWLAAVKLARLSTPTVEQFRDGLLAANSRVMARKVLASLKSILAEAQRRGLVAQNAAQPVKVTVKGREEKRKLVVGRDIPSKEEVSRLLAVASGRWRPFFVTAVFTGMRASELRGLRWADVDLEAKALHVRQRADEWGVIGRPKSAAGDRTIPLAPMVANVLREWRLRCPKGELGLVFPNGLGNVEHHNNIRGRGLDKLQVKAGIVDGEGKPKYGLHTLRHFFASWAIEQGFSPKRLQALLGHSSITMTFDTYGHLFPAGEDDAARFAAGELAVVGG
jgi:integrase